MHLSSFTLDCAYTFVFAGIDANLIAFLVLFLVCCLNAMTSISSSFSFSLPSSVGSELSSARIQLGSARKIFGLDHLAKLGQYELK